MYKYLFLILFGILLFLVNNIEGFNIGGDKCIIPSSTHSLDTLDWSTSSNPYGISMYDTSNSYIDQGLCGTCIIYSIVSQLSCLYNIELYKNINNCDDFIPIMISPRSILDIFMRYRKYTYLSLTYNTYNYITNCNNHPNHRCGFTFLTEYSSVYSSITNLKKSFRFLENNNPGYEFLLDMNQNFSYPFPFIRNHSTDINGNGYENFYRCPTSDKNLFNDTDSSINSNQNYNYTSLFDINYFIDFNLNNYIDILENIPFNISYESYKNLIKGQLSDGPLCIGIYFSHNGQWGSNGKINLETDINLNNIPDYGHAINIIGYNSDEFTILSSFPTERSFITESIYSGVNIQNFNMYKTNIPINYFYNQFILLSRNNQLQKIYKCNITIGKLIDPTNFTDIVSKEQPEYNINTIYGISACIIVGICGLFVCASDIKSPPRNHGRRGSFSILPPDQESDNP